LGELLVRSEETVEIVPTEQYKEVTVRLWGKGVVLRGDVQGQEMAAARRFRLRAGQFILSRIDARNGALGIVPDTLDGAVVSNDFPAYNIVATRLFPPFLGWICRTRQFVDLCRLASEGTTNRVRLQEDRFLRMAIPLPPLSEQQRIVAKIEELAAKIEQARALKREILTKQGAVLTAAYHQIIRDAPVYPLSEVAPLLRRPVSTRPEKEYAEIGIRSFGRGTFAKPMLLGAELTWQRLYEVRAGDILLSNIKAWEGAIAVVRPEDDGRVGSHRYLTCVPIAGKATATFVCFPLLSPKGLQAVNDASPGSADRNRTLGMEALQQIPIPTPNFEKQCWFDQLVRRVEAAQEVQARSDPELDALLPSILDRAFKGEL
jgi:type I restriction enzyme S subunit